MLSRFTYNELLLPLFFGLCCAISVQLGAQVNIGDLSSEIVVTSLSDQNLYLPIKNPPGITRCETPVWHSNRLELLATCQGAGPAIYTANLKKLRWEPIVEAKNAEDSIWSPDGEYLLFTERNSYGEKGRKVIFNLRTHSQQLLRSNENNYFESAWLGNTKS